MATYVNYMNKVLKYLWNYRNNLFKYEREYYLSKSDLYSRSTLIIKESPDVYAHEAKINNAIRTATVLYNELCDIANRFQAGAEVGLELQYFNNKINSACLPIFVRTTITLKTVKDNSSFYGTMTGGAVMPTEPKKADFLGRANNNWNMQKNMEYNSNYPDAQELANIFLASPENAPASEEYKFIEPGYAETLNSIYNLESNKKIGKNWSGFVYSRYSTLAKNVSNFSGLKLQLASAYNRETGQFNKNKIDINFKGDTNLFRALGNATILNPRVDTNGYFHGILFDKYDFKLNYKDIYDDTFITVANDYFWLLQKLSGNKNFYILVPLGFKW